MTTRLGAGELIRFACPAFTLKFPRDVALDAGEGVAWANASWLKTKLAVSDKPDTKSRDTNRYALSPRLASTLTVCRGQMF